MNWVLLHFRKELGNAFISITLRIINRNSFFAISSSFKKKNISSSGGFKNEPAFTWFEEKKITFDFEFVLEVEYDFMVLTPWNHKDDYGTPSKLLHSLI